MSVGYKVPRGTRAALDAKAGAATIVVGQIYLLTDEDRICVGTSTTTYEDFEKRALVSLQYTFDGGGVALTTDTKELLHIPFAMTLVWWTMASLISGSATVGLWKDVYANLPPTSGDSIVGGGTKPTLSSATKSEAADLTSWTTTIAADSYLMANLDSVSTTTKLWLFLWGVKG